MRFVFSRLRRPLFLAVVACCSVSIGCVTPGKPWKSSPPRISSSAIPPPLPELTRVSASVDTTTEIPSELSPDQLVRLVLLRNPLVEQMQAAASAAQAKYAQVTSLDDPMFGFTTAPGSIGSPNANYAARVEISQKILASGKLELRGQRANSEAAAALHDVDDARLKLAETTRIAYADYYLASQRAEIGEESIKLLKEFRQNAETRYKNGLSSQQDMLQAEVEIARQEERLVSIRRARNVSQARINTLLHRPANESLPAFRGVNPSITLPNPAELRQRAIALRPDVKALNARIAADKAALGSAQREYAPDVELTAAYDSFWQGAASRPFQWQIGARVNLPIRYSRRDGAVNEAKANLIQRRATLNRLSDQIAFEVQESYEQLKESLDIIELYRNKILPAAEGNIKAAQSAYITGKVPFLSLAEARRSLIESKDRYVETLAESIRRRAILERAVGDSLFLDQSTAPSKPS